MMLSSIGRHRCRCILAGANFLSRLFTALNLLPSMATMACVNKSKLTAEHDELPADIADPPPVVLAEVGGSSLKSGISRPVSHINSTLRYASRSRRRLD